MARELRLETSPLQKQLQNGSAAILATVPSFPIETPSSFNVINLSILA